MQVWVFESNLLWSVRLLQTLKAHGVVAATASHLTDEMAAGDVAILNLATRDIDALVQGLHLRQVKTLAHAGHKEKELHELGKGLGISRLATNSELTYKLPEILAELAG